MGAHNRRTEAELRGQESFREQIGLSEAEKARRALRMPQEAKERIKALIAEAEAERERLGPLVRPQSGTTMDECLEVASTLSALAGRVGGLGDAYAMVMLAQGYLGRVQEELERGLTDAADPDVSDSDELPVGSVG